jgi:quercetin dioxygenase-like cupin family protein
MDIRRFGPGVRRPDGPPGTRGVTGQIIHQDRRGLVAEMALGPRAMVAPHVNPNTALFVVVSGGGFVQVGEERARISHGEAVLWPAGVPHGAYTDGTEMRAIIVEFTGVDEERSARTPGRELPPARRGEAEPSGNATSSGEPG